MRKIAIKPNNLVVLVDDIGNEVPLFEFCEQVRVDNNTNIGALQREADVAHPSYSNVAKGKSDSLKVMVKILDYLGYDFILTKRKEK